MTIAGWQQTSLIDFPGRVSCVLFLAGCNFHCPYCHNPDLLSPDVPTVVAPGDLEAFLHQRRGFLDGVVITGGEPTLDPALDALLARITAQGYAVKLDTNGSRPEVLARLLDSGRIDYVAMDVKTDPRRYAPLISTTLRPEVIRSSVGVVMASGIPYEFRTTCAAPLVDEPAVHAIAELLDGAERHVLQRFQPARVLDRAFFADHPRQPDESTLACYHALLAPHVRHCSIRS